MPSSSRPYRSKILSFVLSQFQQGVERHRHAVRQVKTVAVIGAQVALSIVYAVRRAARLASHQLGQTVATRLALPDWLKGNSSDTQAQTLPELSPERDSKNSIPQVLAVAVQCLEPDQQKALRLTGPGLLGRLGQLLKPTSSTLDSVYPDQLQGIASDIATHSIILIGQGNQLWDVLTAEQQSYLRRQILTLVNAYWQHPANQPTIGTRLRRWLPYFGQGKLLSLLGQIRPDRLFQSPVTGDVVISQFLADVQGLLPPEQAALCLSAPGQIQAGSGSLVRPGSSVGFTLTTPGVIQGIASDLRTQALILVGDNNVLWDVLTHHQQGYLKQHIWMLIEAYWQYQHQDHTLTQRWVERLSLPTAWQHLFLPGDPLTDQLLLGALPLQGSDQSISKLMTVAVQCLGPSQKSQLQIATPSFLDRLGQLLSRRSSALESSAPAYLQGLASDLKTRSIVLVGQGNQLWDVLTAEQQHYLRCQILTLVTAYGQYHLTQPILGELVRQRILKWLPKMGQGKLLSLRDPARTSGELSRRSVTGSTIISQCMADMQMFLPPDQVALCLPSSQPIQSSSGTLASRDEGVLTCLTPDVLQGIASDVKTQSLILVGTNNVLWDVLTLPQQDYLKNHIGRLIEAYWQYQYQSLRLTQRMVAQLSLPMPWKQFRLAGIFPTLDVLPWRQQQGGFQQIGAKASIWGEVLSVPVQTVLAPLQDWLQVPFPHPVFFPRRWTQPKALPGQVSPRESAGLMQTASGMAIVEPTPPTGLPRYVLPEGTYLETEVTSMEYIEHPLEKLLRWIDGLLSWVEDRWRDLIRWLRTSFS